MERISQAALSLAQQPLALQPMSRQSMQQLSDEEYNALAELVTQMALRYPSQDLTDALEGYLTDFERLAVRTSLQAVYDALAELRISSQQKFFPRPDEVAAQIERDEDARRAERTAIASCERIENEERHFWKWVDEYLEDNPGMTEQALLDSIKVPGYTGRKARQK